MLQINDDTTIVGKTELRTEFSKLSKNLKGKKIIVIDRNHPVAVIESFEEYEDKERLIDDLEDFILGHIAKERYENSTEDDYISEEEMWKKLELND